MTILAVVDTETNALGDLAVPYEIAIVKRNLEEPSVPDGEYLFQVQYTTGGLPAGTDPESLNVGGWRDRVWGMGGEQYRAHLDETDPQVYVATGPEWTIARSVLRVLDGVTLATVGPFDLPVLRRMFLRHGLIRPDQDVWHYGTHDLKSQAYGYALARGYRPALPMHSEELSNLLGVPPTPPAERHTALGDARWALRMWDAMYSPDRSTWDQPAATRYPSAQADVVATPGWLGAPSLPVPRPVKENPQA